MAGGNGKAVKKKEGRKLLEDLRSMLGDRVIYLALIFSLAAHGALMFLLKDWPATTKKKKPAMIVARLVRLSDRQPSVERGEGEEDVKESEEDTGAVTGRDEKKEPLPPEEKAGERRAAFPGIPGFAGAVGTAAAAASGIDGAGGRRIGGRFTPSLPVRATGKGVLSLAGQASGGTVRSGSVAAALAEIRRRVEAKKRYPALARRKGWEGKVLVELRLGGNGELESLRLLQPSGVPLLDRATLRAVESAVPFPPLPGTVRIPVTYDLQD